MSTFIVGTGTPSPEELSFQEKMKDRMRAAFGDLMPDETLAKLVAQGIHEAFFKDVVIKSRESWSRDEIKKSWLIQFVEQEAKEQVKVAVQKWIVDNPEIFKEAVDKVINKGIASAFIGAFDSILHSEINNLRTGVADAIQRVRNGN